MDKDFKKGDRIIAYKDKRGEVINSQNSTLFIGYAVKLDDGTEQRIPLWDLEAEDLTSDEIDTEIKKLENLIKENASKITEKLVKEIPEHLKYLQSALKFKHKSESENEYIYISREMEREIPIKSAESIISLKKLKHCWVKMPKQE